MEFLKRRGRRAVQEHRVALASVETFEYTITADDSVLIRLACRWIAPPKSPAQLIIHDGAERTILEPLPDARVDGNRCQAGYAAPPSVLVPDAWFALAVEDGSEAVLPKPAERQLPQAEAETAPAPEAASAPRTAPQRETAAEARTSPASPLDPQSQPPQANAEPPMSIEDARALIELLEGRCKVAEQALANLRTGSDGAESEKLVKAWRECAELRELLESREAEHKSAKVEAARLRKRHAQVRHAVDEAVRDLGRIRETAQAECLRLQAELEARRESDTLDRAALAEAREREEELRLDAQAAQERFERARTRAATLERELAEVADARSRAEAEAMRQRDELVELRARAEEAEERAAAAEAVAERDAAKIVELEGQLASAHETPAQGDAAADRIAAVQAEAERHAARVKELEQELARAAQRARELETELEQRQLDGEGARASAAEERAKVLEAQAADAARLREKLERLKRSRRRALFGRRQEDEDSRLSEQVAENERLSEQLANVTEELRVLQSERATDADRLSEDRLALDTELRKQRAIAEDLRALLESERRQAEDARRGAEALRGRLAEVPTTPPVETDVEDGDDADHDDWSAMDDELLARLEKAKALSSTP